MTKEFEPYKYFILDVVQYLHGCATGSNEEYYIPRLKEKKAWLEEKLSTWKFNKHDEYSAAVLTISSIALREVNTWLSSHEETHWNEYRETNQQCLNCPLPCNNCPLPCNKCSTSGTGAYCNATLCKCNNKKSDGTL